MTNEWNGGDLVSDDDFKYINLLYRLSLKVEYLENPNKAPKRSLGPIFYCGDDCVISNEMAIELNRLRIPKPKRKKRSWLQWFE